MIRETVKHTDPKKSMSCSEWISGGLNRTGKGVLREIYLIRNMFSRNPVREAGDGYAEYFGAADNAAGDGQ
ncbi:MAG: hypothetical protein FWD92_03455 [Methanomassiliicoccaceae archaeon]|nr:hypothetical protein [Methanomassiliicoccaceae archaeon]